MTDTASAVRISSFLIKIASRCNLACDYCYMYKHADQGWKLQPPKMSSQTRRRLAVRIGDYVASHQMPEVSVVFHGGEPLLAGAETIAETADWIRTALPAGTKASFSLQTNGVLLDEEAVRLFLAADIGVSLSLDGNARAHDLHRLDHLGRSTYQASISAFLLLQQNPRIFSGVISVVDPRVPPNDLFGFFAAMRPPRWDFLLPDAHHDCLPPGRDSNPALYENWLIEAFDLWFDKYPDLQVRTFEALVGACVGLPSQTDAFGFGEPSLLTIETDGSYHDLDVLKITQTGFTSLGMDIDSSSIEDASRSSGLARHASLLRIEGLSKQCQHCPESKICGGGAVPHRYSEANGLNNPTVYCREMLSLIRHIRGRLNEAVEVKRPKIAGTSCSDSLPDGLPAWERPETSYRSVQLLLADLAGELIPQWELLVNEIGANNASLRDSADELLGLTFEQKSALVVDPAVRLWITVRAAALEGKTIRSTSGAVLPADPYHLNQQLERISGDGSARRPRVHTADALLRAPFEGDVFFEQGECVRAGEELTHEALKVIHDWDPSLLAELELISPDIQFVVDPNAGPNSVVSFSDDSVPGCLYVSVRTQDRFLDAPLLADSIIHEHRHQKLYLLQRKVPLVQSDLPLINSPWRRDPRPPSGLLHALFVFVPLFKFWQYLGQTGSNSEFQARARKDAASIAEKLERGFEVIRTTKLTKSGEELVDILENSFRTSTRD